MTKMREMELVSEPTVVFDTEDVFSPIWDEVLELERVQNIIVSRPLEETVDSCISNYGVTLTKSAISKLVADPALSACTRMSVKELLNKKEFVM